MSKNEFYERFQQEAEERIREIENPDYEFPKKFAKADWVGAILLMAAAAVIVVVGYWL